MCARDIRRVTSTGRSWCVVVPSGYVVVRRNHTSTPVVVHNCLITHGASQMILDRLLDNSDPAMLTVCGTRVAGAAGVGAHRRAQPRVRVPKLRRQGRVTQMHTPYSFRLLLQELQAMSVAVRFDFDEESA